MAKVEDGVFGEEKQLSLSPRRTDKEDGDGDGDDEDDDDDGDEETMMMKTR